MKNLYQAVADNDLKAVKNAFAVCPQDAAGALENAAELGLDAIVRFLVRRGVRHEWAVVNAARFGHLRTVRFLLKNAGGNLKAAFIAAAAHNRPDVVRFLFKSVPELPLNEALADAALKGFAEIVGFLLKKGADPHARVYAGQTAFSLAQKAGRENVLKLLEKYRNARGQ